MTVKEEKDETTQIYGAWQLLAYEVEVKTTGEMFAPIGQHSSGYVIFTPEGCLSFTLPAEGRIPAQSIEGNASLLKSIIAYNGTYRLDEDRWVTQVDVAWNPECVGTEQTRYLLITGNNCG